MRITELFEAAPIRLDLSRGGMMTIPMHSDEVIEPTRTITLKGFGKREGTAASRFIQAWEGSTEHSMFNPNHRMHGMAAVEVKQVGTDTVRISDIMSNTRGEGSRAMKELCWLADKYDVEIELSAMGYGKTPTPRLVGWYQRFGFEPLASDWEAHLQPPRARDSIDEYKPDSVDMKREPKYVDED